MSIFKRKRKTVIECYSEEDMENKMEALVKQGIRAERSVGVWCVPSYCMPIYRIICWY